MTVSEIKNMSRIERLRMMESLWDSFFDDDSEMDSPEWHTNILEERKQLIETGKAEFLSIEELKAARRL